MPRRRKKGFTLVELLVVMSIIGVLSAALISQVTNMMRTARAAKCKANLKNLAQAALNYGVDNGVMPWAGSHEYIRKSRTASGFVDRVHLRRGWVDWTTDGGSVESWPKSYSSGSASFSSKGKMVASIEEEAGYLSVTNGTLWSYTGRDLSVYVCEAHKSKLKSELRMRSQIYRSYFMNGYYGYNKDYFPVSRTYRDVYVNDLANRGSASTLLLFAELPVSQTGVDKKLAVDGVIETVFRGYNDGADTQTSPQRETIGFNHLVGKRKVAHLAYADGHVDVFHMADKEYSDDQLKGLTYFFCNGYDLPADKAQWKVPN